MSEPVSNTMVEDYKGILQQYCQKRALGHLTYETDRQGTPNEPSWVVTVKYGEATYTTPIAIPGSKRWAEKMAAKQVLEQIESRQEAFLAGCSESGSHGSDTIETTEMQKQSTEVSSPDSVNVPTELVTTALGIANHRLAGLQRGTRYRDSVESKQGNQAFAQHLAELTIQIVREVAHAAETSGVKFGDTRQSDPAEFGGYQKEGINNV